jgi:hypothetical protein
MAYFLAISISNSTNHPTICFLAALLKSSSTRSVGFFDESYVFFAGYSSWTLLEDAFESNLKRAEWGMRSSLVANLKWVASRLVAKIDT